MDLVMKRYVQFIVHLFTVICSIDGNNSNPQKATIEFQITSIIQRLVKLTFRKTCIVCTSAGTVRCRHTCWRTARVEVSLNKTAESNVAIFLYLLRRHLWRAFIL